MIRSQLIKVEKDSIINCPFCGERNIFSLRWVEIDVVVVRNGSKTCEHFKDVYYDDALNEAFAKFEEAL